MDLFSFTQIKTMPTNLTGKTTQNIYLAYTTILVYLFNPEFYKDLFSSL